VNATGEAATILVIDDEPTLVRGLRDAFEHHGFRVLSAEDGESGLQVALSGQTDLIILDLMLPKLAGSDVCRGLRSRGVRTPILMLTARGGEPDRVAGLDIGADDYVTKPFSIVELVARARALIRRAAGEPGVAGRVQIGEAIVDFKEYVVRRAGVEHPLTKLEVELLRLLVAHPREVITRDRLLSDVWGFKGEPTTRTIDTFLLRLRQKIEADPAAPAHLVTVHGAGYKFVP
jgi:DNA-binding response OmpR family regulator